MQSSVSPDSVIGALTIVPVSGSQLQTNIGEESTEGLAIVNLQEYQWHLY